jgi:hypothetical protein
MTCFNLAQEQKRSLLTGPNQLTSRAKRSLFIDVKPANFQPKASVFDVFFH